MMARVVPLLVATVLLLLPVTAALADEDGMATCWFQPTFSDVVALIGIVFGGGTLLFGVLQARLAQAWKRKEFVAQQMEKLSTNPSVKRAKMILDYTARKMDLTDDKLQKDLLNVRVDQEWLAAGALVPHAFGKKRLSGKPKFSRTEVAIRDIFDEFLDSIENFYPMIKAGLVKFEDVKSYLAYWLESIADTELFLKPAFKRSLWIYINEYEFTGVQELCRMAGHPIKPSDSEVKELRKELQSGRLGAALTASDEAEFGQIDVTQSEDEES